MAFTSELMKKVHKVARTLQGHYYARLSLAFKIVNTEIIAPEGLKNVKSAKAWEGYGKQRIYIQLNCVSKNQNAQKDYYIENVNEEWVAPNYNLAYYLGDVLEILNGKDLNSAKNLFNI